MNKKQELLDAIMESLYRREKLFRVLRFDVEVYAEQVAARSPARNGEPSRTNVDVLKNILEDDEAYQALVRHLSAELATHA